MKINKIKQQILNMERNSFKMSFKTRSEGVKYNRLCIFDYELA